VGYHNTLTAAAGPAPASTPMAAGASSADRPLSANAADPACPTVATVAVVMSSTSNMIIRFTLTSMVSTTDVFARSGMAADTSHRSPVDTETGYRWTKTLDAANAAAVAAAQHKANAATTKWRTRWGSKSRSPALTS